MAESEEECSDVKKRKLLYLPDPVFVSFHSQNVLVEELTNSIKYLHTFAGYSVTLLRIRYCNGMYPSTFSNACCGTEQYECEDKLLKESTVQQYSLASIFKHGDAVLKGFVKPKHEVCLPQRKGANIALSRLLNFLSSEMHGAVSILVDRMDVPSSESDWALLVVHHVLSRLAVSPVYVMDQRHHEKYFNCPCPCKEDLYDHFGDTSIGNPDIWHGFVDVIMDVSIKIEEDDESYSSGLSNRKFSEVKQSWSDVEKFKEQSIAQAIVFSFFQRKIHPEYKNHLIPTFAISKEHIVIYLYDSNNDMLLQSCKMRYINCEKREFIQPTITAVWLALNYKYFCSGITSTIKKTGFKSGFMNLVESKLDLYKEKITFPCPIKSKSDEEVDSWKWASLPIDDNSPVEDINFIQPAGILLTTAVFAVNVFHIAPMYRDCSEIYKSGINQTGVFTVYPWRYYKRPVLVFCDQEGWTVIQRRLDGSVSFNRNWNDYKNGFGNVTSEYWLGNNIIHQLTSIHKSRLHISLTLANGSKYHEEYFFFGVGSEFDKYRLHLGGPVTGTAGDRMMDTDISSGNLGNMKFSTMDRDNEFGCANYHNGGWWFNDCHFAFLNGLYFNRSWMNPWYPLVADGSGVKETSMSINSQT